MNTRTYLALALTLTAASGCTSNKTPYTFHTWQQKAEDYGVIFEEYNNPITRSGALPFETYYVGKDSVDYRARNTNDKPVCIRFDMTEINRANFYSGGYKDFKMIKAKETVNVGSLHPFGGGKSSWRFSYSAKDAYPSQPDPCKPPSSNVSYDDCYITTAVCSTLGKGDKCDELETLRWYRDNVLRSTEQGLEDIKTYYRTAPEIVARINARKDAAQIYRRLLEKYLQPAVTAVKDQKYDRAYQTYRAMVDSLADQYLAL